VEVCRLCASLIPLLGIPVEVPSLQLQRAWADFANTGAVFILATHREKLDHGTATVVFLDPEALQKLSVDRKEVS
jgi:hypothetical protein